MKLRESLQMLLDGSVEGVSMYDGGYIYPADLDKESCVINKKPVTEEVEITQYAVIEPSTGEVVTMTDRKDLAQLVATGKRQLVEVKIPYTREVKPKTKQRVDVGSASFQYDKCLKHDSTFYTVEKRPDIIADKSGRLIFEWEE